MNLKGEARLLPRHPNPHTTESLWGYILRVSRANGFRSPWAVIERSGMVQFEARGASINLTKLAAITRKDQARLQNIGYESGTEERSYVLLGHRVPWTALELEQPRVCPECLETLGFIEAHWDLEIMTACTVHLCSAVQNCAACGDRLRWFRPDLLRCHCGARIESGFGASFSAGEVDLLQVIRVKVLRLLPLIDGSSGLPATDLCQLELSDLLRLANVLQDCRRLLSGNEESLNDHTMAVAAAAQYLRDWPIRFFGLLAELRILHLNNARTIRDLYSPIYSAFLRRRESETFDFMRRAFLEFISNHVEGEAADVRVMRSFRFQVERRFITPAELSRRLNIDPRAVARSIPFQENKVKGSKICQAIDLKHFEWKGTHPGVILNLRAAAKELGMPAQVLRALRDSGNFRADNLCAGHVGFHERDLTAFKERLLNCVDQRGLRETGKPGETSSLGHVLKSRRHGTDDKVALLRELLNGNLKAVRGEDDSVLNIRLRMNALQQFWQRRFVSAHGAVVTGADAAKQIGCSYEVVKGLIKSRKICGRKSGPSWLIDAETVEAFRLDFVPVSQLAKMHCTSSRRIKQIYSHEGIPLLRIPLGERRVKLFSSSTDGERISKLLWSKHSVRMTLTDEVKSIADDTKPAHRSNGTGGLQGCDRRIG